MCSLLRSALRRPGLGTSNHPCHPGAQRDQDDRPDLQGTRPDRSRAGEPSASRLVRLDGRRNPSGEFSEEPVSELLEEAATEFDDPAGDIYLHARRYLRPASWKCRETAQDRHSRRARLGGLPSLAHDLHAPGHLVHLGEVDASAKRQGKRTYLDAHSSHVRPRVHYRVELAARDAGHDAARIHEMIPDRRERRSHDEPFLDRDDSHVPTPAPE